MQNFIILMQPTEDAWDISIKAGKLLLNRFFIDEEAAFELSGVYYLKKSASKFADKNFSESSFMFIHSRAEKYYVKQ